MMEETAVSKISLAYDSVRELLEAWALNAGFKIYNHQGRSMGSFRIVYKKRVPPNIRFLRDKVSY